MRLALSLTVLICLMQPRHVRAQDTRIRGFTDVTLNASDRRGANSNFALGQFDLYITSALADKWSFLGETVFEFQEDFVVDVERLIITFHPGAHYVLAVGKHHTPFGYWNTAYHHGTLMQPTSQRPDMYLFEDDGGILPVHTTGALFAGRDLTRAHLGFDVMIGNGIGATPISDNNPAKSVTLALHSQISPALRVGVNYYRDRLTPGTPRIYGGPTAGNDAAYLYAGYRVGKLVPYGRYDVLLFAPADPHYVADDWHRALIGARYDFAATTQVKAEYHRLTTHRAGSDHELHVQVAIGF